MKADEEAVEGPLPSTTLDENMHYIDEVKKEQQPVSNIIEDAL